MDITHIAATIAGSLATIGGAALHNAITTRRRTRYNRTVAAQARNLAATITGHVDRTNRRRPATTD